MIRKAFSPKILFTCLALLTIIHFIYQNAPKSSTAAHETTQLGWNRSHTVPINKLREWLSLSKLHGGKHKLYQISNDEQDQPPSLPTEVSSIDESTTAITSDSAAAITTIHSYEYHTSVAEEQAHPSITSIDAPNPTTSAVVLHTSPTASSSLLQDEHAETNIPCSQYKGADDIVFIIKTGATEVAEKIPVHFNTTFQCFPNTVLYSDHGENFQGHLIHDAIGNVIDQIRLDTDDFDLWRRLKSNGREGLKAEELSTHDMVDPNGGAGNPDNGGWRLDKFKNIPMVNYTIHQYPNAKWFVHTDADTYIFWSNLLNWLNMMDSEKLIYLGSPAVIGDQVFGHGGSGYIISNALMWKASHAYNADQERWDQFADGHWAGDCVLATMLQELGAPLTWSFPIIQGGDPMTMDFWQFGYDRRLWCYPAVSYHHIKPSTVSSLWHFEQRWMNNSSETIRHSDVFRQWVLPRLSDERDGWDNLSGENDAQDLEVFDVFECREVCNRDDDCMQYRFEDGRCRISGKVGVGKSAAGVQSGWMLEKIQEKMNDLDHCDEGEWILP